MLLISSGLMLNKNSIYYKTHYFLRCQYFSSSPGTGVKTSRNAWNEMFTKLQNYLDEAQSAQLSIDQLKSEKKIKHTRNITFRDRIITTFNENPSYVLLLNKHTLDNKSLGQWLNKQRNYYKKTKKKSKKLEDIHFIWDIAEFVWKIRYNELLSFQREHGHTIVQRTYLKYPLLPAWVKWQRFLYSKKTLPNHRLELLSALQFTWNVHDTAWFKQYEELRQFYQAHGHTKVPSRVHKQHLVFRGLYLWLYKQKELYYKNNLNQEYVTLLDDLDSDWKLKYEER